MTIGRRWTVLALALFSGLAACAADTEEPAQSSESDLAIGGGGVSEGGSCKINSGPNAGKSGTYDTTTDPGHTWCCTGAGGAGDCTECGGTPNKCSSALVKKSVGGIAPGGTLTISR